MALRFCRPSKAALLHKQRKEPSGGKEHLVNVNAKRARRPVLAWPCCPVLAGFLRSKKTKLSPLNDAQWKTQCDSMWLVENCRFQRPVLAPERNELRILNDVKAQDSVSCAVISFLLQRAEECAKSSSFIVIRLKTSSLACKT